MIMNLTPHDITIRGADGIDVIIPPSGIVARVAQRVEFRATDNVDGVSVGRVVFGEVENIPPPQANTVYIVSMIVRDRARRRDVLSPDTGPDAYRNERGQVVAVRRLLGAEELDASWRLKAMEETLKELEEQANFEASRRAGYDVNLGLSGIINKVTGHIDELRRKLALAHLSASYGGSHVHDR